jgi:hypothetical protein
VDFVAVVDQVIALLRQRGRVTYRTLKRQFQLDDESLEDLKEELIVGQRLAEDEAGRVLVWIGGAETLPSAPRYLRQRGRPRCLGFRTVHVRFRSHGSSVVRLLS